MKADFDKVYKAAKQSGAEQVELYLLNSKNLELKAYQGEVTQTSRAQPAGAGVRVLNQGKIGYAWTSNLDVLEQTAINAAEASKYTTYDENNVFPEHSDVEPLLLYQESLEKAPIKEKGDRLIDIERSAIKFDSRVKPIDAIYGEDVSEVTIMNSLGVNYSYKESNCWNYIRVVSSMDGETQSGFSLSLGRSMDELDDVDKLGNKAAKNSVDMLGAKSIGSRKAVTVIDSLVACQFLSLLGRALSADSVMKNKSFLAGKIGEEVASAEFTLVDDGRLLKGPGASPVDSEGEPTKRTAIIENGILKNYLHNAYSAKKMGVQSTGNGFRSSFKSVPSISPSNLFIDNGKIKKDDLLKMADSCFYVLDISGLHAGANPINGEMSVGASGVWLKNGKKEHAVREVTIASDMLSFMKNITAIADDLEFFPFGGGCGSPTLMIKEMTLSGE